MRTPIELPLGFFQFLKQVLHGGAFIQLGETLQVFSSERGPGQSVSFC